ncbi:MAG: SufS family cysteine desulfurase [Planctomycetaceae bacterium]|nr:MAG: SufS family cysteine desulfurase [Planctomycetaceae bacterium]
MSTTTSTSTDASNPLNVAEIRLDFPILQRSVASGKPLIYLDNAASTQRPRVVIDAMSDCYERYYANVHRGIHTLSEESTRAYEAARESVAEFLNAAAPQEVIFTAGTTAAINTVARAWGDSQITADDTLLLTLAEHHANIVPWQQLAERTGCRIVFLPLTSDGRIEDDVVADHLRRLRPKLFAFTAVSNVLGTEFPVSRWVEMARGFKTTVLVDAAQAAPHQAVDVQEWGADFVVFSGHKVCGPTGIGVLHGKEPILEAMPPFLGGGSMIRTVTTEGFVPAGLPMKFEAGTPPIAEAIGLAAAVRYLQRIGLENIRAHEKRLAQLALESLSTIDAVTTFGPAIEHRAGLVSFVIDGAHPHDLAHWLDRRGVAVRAGHHCAMPLHQHLGVPATCRASFYLYNTELEVERFGTAVADFCRKFAGRSRRPASSH